MAFLFRAEDATHSSVASLVVFKLWRTLNHKPFQFIRSEAKPAKPQSPECQIATPRKVVESPSPELLNPPRSQQGKLPKSCKLGRRGRWNLRPRILAVSCGLAEGRRMTKKGGRTLKPFTAKSGIRRISHWGIWCCGHKHKGFRNRRP